MKTVYTLSALLIAFVVASSDACPPKRRSHNHGSCSSNGRVTVTYRGTSSSNYGSCGTSYSGSYYSNTSNQYVLVRDQYGNQYYVLANTTPGGTQLHNGQQTATQQPTRSQAPQLDAAPTRPRNADYEFDRAPIRR